MISQAEAEAWVAAYGDAWMSRDPDKVGALFTPDATYRERRFRPALDGITAIRNYWEVIVREQQRDVVFSVEQVVVSGDQAFVHWRSHFVWQPVNAIMELDSMARISFATDTHNGLRLAAAFEEWIDRRES